MMANSREQDSEEQDGVGEMKGNNDAGRTQGLRLWSLPRGAGEAIINRKEGRAVTEAKER